MQTWPQRVEETTAERRRASHVRDVNGAAVTIDTTAAPPELLGILAGLSDAIPLGLGAFQSAECPNSRAGPLARHSEVHKATDSETP